MAIEMYKGMNLTGTPSWHGTRDEYDNLAIHDPNTMYFIEDETGSCILWKGTREMFNNLPAEYKNDNTLYVITDESIQSEDISYDNSTSGLSATNVQAAIDEVVSEMGGGTASDITYDNTTSGLVATDVQDAIDEVNTKVNTLPKPMQYKGTLGTGGTIQTLPTASDENYGHVYKVITAGTYSSQASKVGDMFISNGTEWTYIPSGDDANSFADLTDTNISSPSTGQLPMYDATTGMWKNEDYIKEVTYATWQSMTPEQKANGKYIVSDYPTVTTAPIIDNQSTSENVWSGQKINTELGNKVNTSDYSGSTLKTSVSKTGSGSTVTNTINSNTSMDTAIGTLLNNDYAISNNLTKFRQVWSGNIYQNGQTAQIQDFSREKTYAIEYLAFSGSYKQSEVVLPKDSYSTLQLSIVSVDANNQIVFARYRYSVSDGGLLTIQEVLNTSSNVAIIGIYEI